MQLAICQTMSEQDIFSIMIRFPSGAAFYLWRRFMDFSGWKETLDEALDAKEAEMFSLLADLVSIDSPTTHASGVNAVGDRLEAELKKHGFGTLSLSKGKIPQDEAWQSDLGEPRMAFSHDPAFGPGVALIGHMDTVFPVGTASARPFRLDREMNVATGPGVADMKAGLVAMVFASLALKETGLLDFPITLMFSSDEELGSPVSSRALRANLPGAFAVLCAEPGGLEGKVTVSRKGSGHMRLKAYGAAAHAGRDYEKGASAILELADKILAIDKLVDLSRGRTINTGLIKGGISANSTAPWAEAAIHLTYRTLADGEYVVKTVQDIIAKNNLPGTSCSLSGGLRLYPLERSQKGDELFELVKKSGHILGIDIKGQHYESAAESGFCAGCLKLAAICCMGPEGENIHSDKEFMRPSTLLPRTKLLALSALAAARHFGHLKSHI